MNFNEHRPPWKSPGLFPVFQDTQLEFAWRCDVTNTLLEHWKWADRPAVLCRIGDKICHILGSPHMELVTDS